ncbi:MAG: ATP-binding protein [Anaerolineae bacterium]
MIDKDVIQIEIPSHHKHLRTVTDAIGQLLAYVEDAQTVYNVQLAMQEACTNIVEHAHKSQPECRIRITMSAEPHCFVGELVDHGEPYDISVPPDIDLETPHVRGYGLFLIHQLMDEITYNVTSDGNHWRLVKYF